MKIGFIGRDEIFDILIKEHINKMDVQYASYQENYYTLNTEVIKLYKITNLDVVYIDYCCLENDIDAHRIIKSLKAIRFNIRVILVVRERKLFNSLFETLELKYTEKKKVSAKKIKEKEDKVFSPVRKREKNGKSKSFIPAFSLPKVDISKFDFSALTEVFHTKENKITEKETALFKSKEPVKNIKIPLHSSVTILHSPFELQGTSRMVSKIKQEYENIAVLDVDLSYIKYTSFESVEEYLEQTYISTDESKTNNHHIYTVKKEPLEILKVINFLSTQYQYILLDINSRDIVYQIQNPNIDLIYVLSPEIKNLKAFQKEKIKNKSRLLISEPIYEFISDSDIKSFSGWKNNIIMAEK